MTATTITRPVGTNPSSTGTTASRRWVAVAIAALFAASFLISRVTTTHHAATFTVVPKLSAADAAQVAGDVSPVTAQMSAADAAQIAGDVSPVTVQVSGADAAQVASDVAPVTVQMSAANSAQIAGDVASVGAPVTAQLSAADRTIVAGDVAPLTSHLTLRTPRRSPTKSRNSSAPRRSRERVGAGSFWCGRGRSSSLATSSSPFVQVARREPTAMWRSCSRPSSAAFSWWRLPRSLRL